ncbi:MAG: hypothetical protein ACQCN6_01620 [Candidatus Bathyarchaeia archaeon]|jgi:hypothetical protein
MEKKKTKKTDVPAFERACQKDEALEAQKALEEKQKLAESLSIRERIMRRSKNRVIPVKLQDDLGAFTVRFRPLTWSEQKDIAKVQGKIAQLQKESGDNALALIETIEHDFIKYVSSDKGVCLEPELTEAYWLEGNFDPEVIKDILKQVSSATQAEVAEARSFR